MAKLTAKARQNLRSSQFALPGKGEGKGGKGSGSFPIPDRSHAINALARSSGKPVEGKVRSAVHRKFPGIGKKVGGIIKPPMMPRPLRQKLPRVPGVPTVPTIRASTTTMSGGGVATCGKLRPHGGFADLGIHR